MPPFLKITNKTIRNKSTPISSPEYTDRGHSYASLFVQPPRITCAPFTTSDSWVILSPIERSIKEKIEKLGTPLKDWDVQINYGIKTGCNEAFIITTEKRNELLAACQTDSERERTAELIRPILRGRDIKRYGYNWADLWLINTHNGIKEKGIPPVDINQFPTIKNWLDHGGIAYNGKPYKGYAQIANRADQGVTPYNLRNCAYMEDFEKPKIVYSEIVKKPQFYLDSNGKFFPEATVFFMTGKHLKYLYNIFNSTVVSYFFKIFYAGGGLGEDGFRYKKQFFEQLPIPLWIGSPIQERIEITDDVNCQLLYDLYEFNENEIAYLEHVFIRKG